MVSRAESKRQPSEHRTVRRFNARNPLCCLRQTLEHREYPQIPRPIGRSGGFLIRWDKIDWMQGPQTDPHEKLCAKHRSSLNDSRELAVAKRISESHKFKQRSCKLKNQRFKHSKQRKTDFPAKTASARDGTLCGVRAQTTFYRVERFVKYLSGDLGIFLVRLRASFQPPPCSVPAAWIPHLSLSRSLGELEWVEMFLTSISFS